MSALPASLPTTQDTTPATRRRFTLDELSAALVARRLIFDTHAARAGQVRVIPLDADATPATLTPDLHAALALHRDELLRALTAKPAPVRPVSVCAWGAPHFSAWRYHAGERRLVCAICYPSAWTPEAGQGEAREEAREDTTMTADKPTTTATPATTPQGAQGGYMLRLERDADGHMRAVPDAVTYFETTGAPDRLDRPETLPDASDAAIDAASDAASDKDKSGRPWRIWRATDAEPGDAPDFASFDYLARALWFGEALADETPENRDACRAAWARLCSWIAREYPGCHAKRTPGATGLELVQHTLPWGKGQKRPYVYPTLPADLARLLAATTPAHRMELLTLEGAKMRRYTQYDARIAHAAYLRHLPVLLGEDTSSLIHDDGPYIPYRAGKYRVAVTVPQGWAHIGLVQRATTNGATWEYPATPGEEWEAWLDESAVRLLSSNPLAPWPFAVRERILFADPKTPGVDPLREHAARITGYLERLDREAHQPGQTPAQARETQALRNAARAVALHPIGLWHKRENARPRHVASLDELTPDDAAATIVPDADGGYTVTVNAALSGFQAHWRRVEWSSTIYAREHVTATRRALSAPRASVLAIRGDAVSFADYAPDWPDTGKVGAYRVKVDLQYPRARHAPRTDADLLALGKTQGKGEQE